MSLSVLEAAAESPNQTALVRDGRALRFAELAERVRRRMHWLEAAGVHGDEGTPVALVAAADSEFVEFLFASFELGAPVLLVHPRLTQPERAELLRGVPLAGVFASPWPSAGDLPPPLDASPRSFEPGRALAILFTSGSSGAPKGVVLSRGAFLSSARASSANLGWQADDRWLLGLPPAHIGGLSVLTRCLIARRAVVLTEPARSAQGADPRSLAELIEREGVSLLSLVPTQLARLLDLEPAWDPPSRVRAILLGGAAAPPRLLARARQRNWPLLTTYGLTEACSQVATQSPRDTEHSSGVGRALPGIEARTQDGRIQVRGPVLFTRYFPSGVLAPLTDGWFQTGDYGKLDASGVLHVTGRSSELIISGGENVWPDEVEHTLLECHGVLQACVFALPHETWGEVLCVAIVADNAVFELEHFKGELRARLASFKRPRQIAVLSALPLTASGKPNRNAARRLAAPSLVAL
ncbi:MAG TPA: class I adenylate-forming enzyme family protein [Polyangiaceae bacterium]|nr:class I adenylate-forming enzyme family protein [Polyangiaceae bacterium]